MTKPQRTELRDWYRDTVRERFVKLQGLLSGVGSRERDAEEAARDVVESLRSSGTSYGFDAVTRAAELVMAAERQTLHPRLAGFVDVLRDVAEGGTGGGTIPHGWIVHAAAPFPDGMGLTVIELSAERDVRLAWRRVSSLLGVGEAALAERIAINLGIGVADLDDVSPVAGRLVPLSLVEAGPVLPLREDGTHMVAAAANPTDVRLMAALERITARRAVLEVAPPAALQQAVLHRLPDPGLTAHVPSLGEPWQGTRTVLVVDDDPTSRYLVRTVLEREGYAVLEAGDGIEALEKVEEAPEVDALVVDLLMPLMDGREVVRRMRAAGKDIPILVLTGSTRPETEAQLIEDGADDYMRKPLDPRLFLARVGAVLRRRGR